MLGIDRLANKLFASQEGFLQLSLLVFHNTHFGDKFYTATDRKHLFNPQWARTDWDTRVPVSHAVVALHRKW